MQIIEPCLSRCVICKLRTFRKAQSANLLLLIFFAIISQARLAKINKRGKIAMTAINYAKYENKTTRQLSVLLDNAEKRLHKEIELVEYLRSKILESVKPTKYNFVPYTQSEAYKIGLEREKMRTPEQQAQLEKEVQELMSKDYNDEL